MAWSAISVAFKAIAQSSVINQLQENINVIRDRLFLTLFSHHVPVMRVDSVDPTVQLLTISAYCYIPEDYDLLRFSAIISGGITSLTIATGALSVALSSTGNQSTTLDISSLAAGFHLFTVTLSGADGTEATGICVQIEPNGSVT